jgi:thiol-disulfide isomerase/thioredoxin
MRRFILILAVALTGGTELSAADEPKAEKKQPSLGVGDAAPTLRPSKWLRGSEITNFAPGRVYVVEFWATWCGPCVVMMPHLGDLQEEMGPKGVTIVGFTAEDPNNSLDQVNKFLDKRGDKLGYTIAFADNRETYDAYMKAAGKSGIPCSYVIGKDGKIAYIGHPLFLDEVLPKVLAGTWDSEKGIAELEAADKLWDATYATLTKKDGDPKKQLAEWDEFSAKWPRLASDPYMNAARLKLLVTAQRFADARMLAESMAKKAAKRNDIAALATVSDAMGDAAGQTDLAALAVRAAESALTIDGETPNALIRVTKAYSAAGNKSKVDQFGPKAVAAAEKALSGEKDVMGTLRLASAYAASGDKMKAKMTAEKAVELASDNPGMKSYFEDQAKKYGAEVKNDKKKDG